MTAATLVWHGLREFVASVGRARDVLDHQAARRIVAETPHPFAAITPADRADPAMPATSRQGIGGFVRSLGRAREALDRQAVRRSAYADTTRELSSYTNKELAELGLFRSDIPRVAREEADKHAARS